MQKRNYHKELEKFISNNKNLGIRPKLLLHSCCAPCSSYPIEYLYPHFDLVVYFYNPNLFPESEYQIRLDEQLKFCEEFSNNIVVPAGFKPLTVVEDGFEPKEFYTKVKGFENEQEGAQRCLLCFDLRLERAFMKAKELSAEYITTTLTISPLKKSQILNRLGKKLEDGSDNVIYLETDFKKNGGFLRSTELSKEYKLYRQNYCGCAFSFREMKERSE